MGKLHTPTISGPEIWKVPFRGQTLELLNTTPPSVLAVIAQIGLADPKLDKFYQAAGVAVHDIHGNIVWPDQPKKTRESEPEGNGIIDLLAE